MYPAFRGGGGARTGGESEAKTEAIKAIKLDQKYAQYK